MARRSTAKLCHNQVHMTCGSHWPRLSPLVWHHFKKGGERNFDYVHVLYCSAQTSAGGNTVTWTAKGMNGPHQTKNTLYACILPLTQLVSRPGTEGIHKTKTTLMHAHGMVCSTSKQMMPGHHYISRPLPEHQTKAILYLH